MEMKKNRILHRMKYSFLCLVFITILLSGCSSIPEDQVIAYIANCEKDYENCRPLSKRTYRVNFESQLVVAKGSLLTYRDCHIFNTGEWICFYKDRDGDGSFGFNEDGYYEHRNDWLGRPLNPESDQYWRGICVFLLNYPASAAADYSPVLVLSTQSFLLQVLTDLNPFAPQFQSL